MYMQNSSRWTTEEYKYLYSTVFDSLVVLADLRVKHFGRFSKSMGRSHLVLNVAIICEASGSLRSMENITIIHGSSPLTTQPHVPDIKAHEVSPEDI